MQTLPDATRADATRAVPKARVCSSVGLGPLERELLTLVGRGNWDAGLGSISGLSPKLL